MILLIECNYGTRDFSARQRRMDLLRPKTGLLLKSEGAFQGYTVIAPRSVRSTFLVDVDGWRMHEWNHELRTPTTA